MILLIVGNHDFNAVGIYDAGNKADDRPWHT